MRSADVILLYADAEIVALGPQRKSRAFITATNNTLDPKPVLAAQHEWTSNRLREFSAHGGFDRKHLILFCGRLRDNPSCELELMIRGMAMAKEKAKEYLLIVIGTGEQEVRLQALARQLNIADSIRWLGPLYEERELAPWFLSAKCFVYPGSIGLSLLHAFSYGLPVVTHDNPRLHNPEIHALHDRENGRLFLNGDAADLWRIVAEICEDEAARIEMGKAARRTALTDWSFDNMVQRVVSAIDVASRRKAIDRLRVD